MRHIFMTTIVEINVRVVATVQLWLFAVLGSKTAIIITFRLVICKLKKDDECIPNSSISGENWAKLLSTVEYAHAISVNASTKLTPFDIDTRRKLSNLIAHEYKDYRPRRQRAAK